MLCTQKALLFYLVGFNLKRKQCISGSLFLIWFEPLWYSDRKRKFLWNCQDNLKSYFRSENWSLLRFHIEASFNWLSCRNAPWLLLGGSFRHHCIYHLCRLLPPFFLTNLQMKIALISLSVCCLGSFLPSTFFCLLFIDPKLQSQDQFYLLGQRNTNKLVLNACKGASAAPQPQVSTASANREGCAELHPSQGELLQAAMAQGQRRRQINPSPKLLEETVPAGRQAGVEESREVPSVICKVCRNRVPWECNHRNALVFTLKFWKQVLGKFRTPKFPNT